MDLSRIRLLDNDIKHYGWGSRTAIPLLLGLAEQTEPCAELWMGAYPGSASRVLLDSGPVALDAYIAMDPERVLGARVVERFGPTLPFLFKVLAAAEPLSIQAHPSLEQAQKGFALENKAGIPIDAGHRNYRDGNHKPELLCALTPFLALDRFRPASEIAWRVASVATASLATACARLRAEAGPETLREVFGVALRLSTQELEDVLERAERIAATREDPAFAWVVRLSERYPGDVGALAPLFLHVVELSPGEALFVSAGELHSYLGGTGVELMANSDNVLRGGLTAKHVDVPELLDTLEFRDRLPDALRPRRVRDCEELYETSAEEFALSVIAVEEGAVYRSPAERNVEILLCTQGRGTLGADGSGAPLAIASGSTVLVPAGAPNYRIEGSVTLYKAAAGPALV